MIIVGFGHRARMGKDTVAKCIVETFSNGGVKTPGKYDIKHYAFADAVKEEVAGRELEMCERYGIPATRDSEGKYRDLLQFWGEYQRSQNPHYWIQRLFTKIDIENPQVAIISDVRYKNEFAYIKDREGYLILVERYKDMEKYMHPGVNHEHKSEVDLEHKPVGTGASDWFAEIRCNDGDVEDLGRSAIELFKMIEDDLDVVGNFIRSMEEGQPMSFRIRPMSA